MREAGIRVSKLARLPVTTILPGAGALGKSWALLLAKPMLHPWLPVDPASHHIVLARVSAKVYSVAY